MEVEINITTYKNVIGTALVLCQIPELLWDRTSRLVEKSLCVSQMVTILLSFKEDGRFPITLDVGSVAAAVESARPVALPVDESSLRFWAWDV